MTVYRNPADRAEARADELAIGTRLMEVATANMLRQVAILKSEFGRTVESTALCDTLDRALRAVRILGRAKAELFMLLAQRHGVDVQYVFTGQRSPVYMPVVDDRGLQGVIERLVAEARRLGLDLEQGAYRLSGGPPSNPKDPVTEKLIVWTFELAAQTGRRRDKRGVSERDQRDGLNADFLVWAARRGVDLQLVLAGVPAGRPA